MAALVSLDMHKSQSELVDLPGELLALTGVAGRIHPPQVARAWVVHAGTPARKLIALPSTTSGAPAPALASSNDTKTIPHRLHLEIEWQLDADDLLGIETALLGRPAELDPHVSPGQVLAIADRYFDTADLRLLRAGYACRLRTSEAGRELTLKATTTVSKGPRLRTERTQVLAAGEDLDAALADGDVADLIHLIAGRRPLTSLFEVRTTRRTFIVSVDGEQTGEISLDRTSIRPEGQGEPVKLRRVEIEALGDIRSVDQLRKFVTSLRKLHHLRWGRQSKFELGLRAGDWLRRGAIYLGPIDIRNDISIGDLARVVIRRHVADLLYHEPGARLGEDSEALHAMRVANRRLRADLRLFAKALPDEWQSIDDELRWLGSTLGAVRDLDIQLARIDGWMAEDTGGELEGLGATRDLLDARRAESRTVLLAALDGPRYNRLIEHMTSLLREETAAYPPFDQPAVTSGSRLLLDLERRVRRGAAGLQPDSDPERFHDLRIYCKRYRYALEAFAPLYGKSAERQIRRLIALQDLLGQHQDAMVTAAEIRALSQEASLSRSTCFTLGRLAERSLSEAARLREGFPDVYRRLERGDGIKLRRRLRRLAASAHGVDETMEV